jgi:hypothetical protein
MYRPVRKEICPQNMQYSKNIYNRPTFVWKLFERCDKGLLSLEEKYTRSYNGTYKKMCSDEQNENGIVSVGQDGPHFS